MPQLEFLTILLGDQPVLAPHVRLYQRLLALDEDEAFEIVDEALSKAPLVEVCDQVIVPALALAERDRHHGELDETHTRFVYETMAELIEDLPERWLRAQIPAIKRLRNRS